MARWDLTKSARVGPALFVVVGLLFALYGAWFPLWWDKVHPSEDSRIGMVMGFFSPITVGCCGMAVYAYGRLLMLQRRGASVGGQVLLVVGAVPAAVCALTALWLLPTALGILPFFLKSVWSEFGEVFGIAGS
jgi:hypothetical protein